MDCSVVDSIQVWRRRSFFVIGPPCGGPREVIAYGPETASFASPLGNEPLDGVDFEAYLELT